MRKLIAILIATAMACAFAPMVGAAPTDHINVTLSPAGTASVVVYLTSAPTEQAVWNGAGAKLGDSRTTTTNTTFTINNTGTVACTVKISASKVNTWTLDEDGGTLAKDTASLLYQIPLGSWTYITGGAGATFGGTLEVAGTNTFGLGVEMPTASSTNAAQGFVITFTATAVA